MPVEPRPFDPAAIRAVAFDGYGTVIHFHTAQFRTAVSALLAEQSLECDLDAFYEEWVHAYGTAGPWGGLPPGDEGARRELMLNGPLPEWHSTREIWRRQFAQTFERFDLRGDPDFSADYLRDLLGEAEPYADAREALERLDRLGMRLGLLSNADEDFLQSALSRGRLRFSAIQSSESLRAYKPHRAVFLAICARLGCEPGEVLYAGDSPYADVSGARNAGLRSAWVRRDETTELPERVPPPEISVTSLAELADRLGAPPALEGETGELP